MKINCCEKLGICTNFVKSAIKRVITFGKNTLERSPEVDTFQVNQFINTPGIKSKTFKKLLMPKFILDTNLAPNGTRMTTLIDKKTQEPVIAYLAMVEEKTPNLERYLLFVKDKKGQLKVNNESYKIVGKTHFYIDKKNSIISPMYELTTINGELYEKVHSYMSASGNNEYGGIGLRLHQLRVERMLQNHLGNVQIVAEGNSFPFHYSMGYRLTHAERPIEDAARIMHEFSRFNHLPPEENSKYLAVKVRDNVQYIDFSASLENCLNDYYRRGGKPIEEFSPNMYLDNDSVKEWMEMIQKQPILY